MTSPRVVVCMGAFNEEQYLRETIPAVLNQTMPDFGFLLTNNGSTDGTGAILREYRDADPRITLIEAPVNLCPGDAANAAYGFAMHRWHDVRWFLGAGADDVMQPDYLQAILDAIAANPTANCVFSPWTWINHPEGRIWHFPPFHPPTIATRLQIPGWRAFTRELWYQVGPEDRAIYCGADWDWAARATVMGVFRPVQLDRPYIALRMREQDGDRKSQSDFVEWPRLSAHMQRHRKGKMATWK